MFKENNNFEKFESKVWLSSPTMHGPEIEYVKEAYETNWMSTVGKNINEVERMACEYIGCKHALIYETGRNRSIWNAKGRAWCIRRKESILL